MPEAKAISTTASFSAGQKDRAVRILNALAKIFRHDFTNQLVVFQGLAQLLELEEKENLGPQGQELLRRMQNAGKRALDMTQQIKDILELLHDRELAVDISLSQFLDDFREHCRFAFGNYAFEWHCDLNASEVRAGPLGMQRLAEQLLQMTLALMPDESYRLSWKSKTVGSQSLVSVRIDGSRDPGKVPSRRIWEGRPEFLLGCEIMAGWDAHLEVHLLSGTTVEFILLFPG